MSTLHFIIIYLAIVNITAFVMYGIDKWRAVSNRTSQGHRKSKKKQKRRIPESTLLGIAIIGGSIGALAGMQIWHHKTLHKKFRYGIPFIIIIQVAIVTFILYNSSFAC